MKAWWGTGPRLNFPARSRGTARHGLSRAVAMVVVVVTSLAACSTGPGPTPYPTPVPTPSPEQASLVARKYLAAWMAGNFERMWELVAPADQARVGHDAFVATHRQFASVTRVTKLTALSGKPKSITLPASSPGPAAAS